MSNTQLNVTSDNPESQWQTIVQRELKRTGSIIVAISRCRQTHPGLWAQLNAPRSEQRQTAAQFEQQATDRVERQR